MSDHKTAAAPTLTGYLHATINGDDNYYTVLRASWADPVLAVTVSSRRPIGGMDGPGGGET
jgi:hypothetical protein